MAHFRTLASVIEDSVSGSGRTGQDEAELTLLTVWGPLVVGIIIGRSLVSWRRKVLGQTIPVAAMQPKSGSRLIPVSLHSVPPGTPAEKFWADALVEFESGTRRPGLWARVFAEAKGEEAVAKAAYLSRRAAEMQEENANRVAAAEREERELAREAELAELSEEQRAYERLPKGSCPSCGFVIPLSSDECPKCRAIFGDFSAWQVVPLK